MPFKFPLATVLKVRENVEHREMLALERRYAELAAAQAAHWQAQETLAAERARQQEDLKSGTTAVQLQTGIEFLRQLERQRQMRELKVLEAQTRLREQQGIYWKARQQRDVLQELRTRQFEEFTRQEDKREQRERDEIFLMRRRWAR